MLQNIWALSWKDSKPSDNSWWLEFSVGSATDMSGAWAGKTQNLDCGLQHLHVASPRSLGFLITWWPQHSGISYMVVQASRVIVPANKVEAAWAFMTHPGESPNITTVLY